MFLYTPMPLELVWETQDQKTEYKEIDYAGKTLLVEPSEQGKGKIIRMISSNPYDYLIPELQPGQEISLFDYRIKEQKT